MWLCPVRSVTISSNLSPGQETNIGFYVNSLNQVEFTGYHKFEAESTLAFEAEPVQDNPVAPAPPPAAPPEAIAAGPLAAQAGVGVPPAVEPAPDAQAIFRVRTNVVTVRAVVRDRQGRATGDLRKDEFALFDNGKPQALSSFSVERPASAGREPVLLAPFRNAESGAGSARPGAAPVPDRYVMYVVDDLNLALGDLSQTRTAAERVLRDALDSASRLAVLTTSGRIVLDFAADWARVNETLNRITPQSRAAVAGRCPPLSYYLADRIVRWDDRIAVGLAAGEAARCGLAIAPGRAAVAAANQAVQEFNVQTRDALAALKAAVRRMSVLPGMRTIVLVSPGFITPDLASEVNDAIDTAARAGVAINTLDARGLNVPPGFDVETRSLGDPEMDRLRRQYDREEQLAQSGVLVQLAEGTGGAVFQNSNDYEGGFRRLTAAPEVSYVLGFIPANLKADGSYHKLKVTIRSRTGLTVQARNGYFAPRREVEPAEQAQEEIERAVFSRDEIQDIPVSLRAQASRTARPKATLTVVAHFGIREIRFVHQEGHHRSSVTAVVSLFDAASGNYIKGVRDIVELDYPDEKLAAAMASGVHVRTGFDAAEGSYVVRLVLRDNDGHMSSTSRLVEVP